MSNLFDFSDTTDLSDSLQKRLSGGGRVNPNIVVYADIVKAGNAAGVGALSISMIEAVASRMKLDTLSQQSIRNALVGAVKAGLIAKVSRQTYGVVPATTSDVPPVEDLPVDGSSDAVDVTDPTDPTDPLA